MSKQLLIAAASVAATLILLGPTPGFAASPSETQCEAQGGTFTRDGGQVSCVVVDEGKNPKFTREEETTGQGNISNKQQQQTDCSGTGSGKCPGGQF